MLAFPVSLSFICLLLLTEASSLRGTDHVSRTLDTTRPVAEWPVGEDGVAHLKVIIDNLLCATDGTADANMIEQYQRYLVSALEDWQKSKDIDIEMAHLVSGECSNEAVSFEGLINVVHEDTPWNQWIGLTSWEVDENDHVTSALVRLNDHFLFNSEREQYTSNASSRQMALCHEMGHAVGLPHQDEVEGNVNSGTCMDYTTHPNGGDGFGPSDLHPNDIDFAALDQAYSGQKTRQHKERELESANSATVMNEVRSTADHSEGAEIYFGELIHERTSKGMIRRHYEQYNQKTGGRTITFTVEHGAM